MDELIAQIARRIRHHAAMDILETLPGPAERMSLLADVICPRPHLEQASLIAAMAEARQKGIIPREEAAA
jgi:hypothetical protein